MKIFVTVPALLCAMVITACGTQGQEPIDRSALLERNSPVVTVFDSLSTLTVGNGHFAFSVDASGLQTFPERYSHGVPLGTMSDWGWHSFENEKGWKFSQTLLSSDFGRGHKEPYAVQKGDGVVREAADFFRQNPHRLHLGNVGLALPEGVSAEAFTDIRQHLDLETGIITSTYKLQGEDVCVRTCAHPQQSMIAVSIDAETPKPIIVRLPYPTGAHSDDACLWTESTDLPHRMTLTSDPEAGCYTVTHSFDPVTVTDELGNETVADASYTLKITMADGSEAHACQTSPFSVIVKPQSGSFSFTCQWAPLADKHDTAATETNQDAERTGDLKGNAEGVMHASAEYWHKYWYEGAVVDFSHCTAPEALELERRVVLSQYLLAVNCAGDTPPQETGLTYNSWFGKFHLEMIWWHQAQFALFGHPELLERSLQWYHSAAQTAQHIASRQGFRGVRWMKMTDPSALEAPSGTGSYLIWQQPHFITLSELVRRAYVARGDMEAATRFASDNYQLVQQTADFMASFASYDTLPNRYVLRGYIPAQETLRAASTINSPFELSQWHYALGVANAWRQRQEGMKDMMWDELRDKLSPLHYINDSIWSAQYGLLYTASEDTEDTYRDIRYTSDHMSVLGALGILPQCPLVRTDVMRNTLHWVIDNWNWGKTWGWDYPMTAMCAARLGEPETAVRVLLSDNRTNTYLISGHNYQDSRLRIYLPGNGGLLTTVAMMCAGWDGCSYGKNPGFPKDGRWDVRWEGLQPLP